MPISQLSEVDYFGDHHTAAIFPLELRDLRSSFRILDFHGLSSYSLID